MGALDAIWSGPWRKVATTLTAFTALAIGAAKTAEVYDNYLPAHRGYVVDLIKAPIASITARLIDMQIEHLKDRRSLLKERLTRWQEQERGQQDQGMRVLIGNQIREISDDINGVDAKLTDLYQQQRATGR